MNKNSKKLKIWRYIGINNELRSIFRHSPYSLRYNNIITASKIEYDKLNSCNLDTRNRVKSIFVLIFDHKKTKKKMGFGGGGGAPNFDLKIVDPT